MSSRLDDARASAERAMKSLSVDFRREALGQFALPRDVLLNAWVFADVCERSDNGENVEGLRLDSHDAFYSAMKAWRGVASAAVYGDVYAELDYLRGLPDGWATDESLAMMSSHLKVIVASPAIFHPFFAADIWDVELIERCIADGIDAELALALVA